ncbi:exodeoxyribonuclease VII large subunit [Mycoplasma sp. P36-A1]|uniref:exodeoxyribonuclease VII large subunit n=1 Tax=Mycoplasma sp. P36-A1 TaxID=3252900 RepID=UPI003C2C4192
MHFDKVSVSEVVQYLKNKNENDSLLKKVALNGELSNVKIYPSGHMYFDLKDEVSKISGIMFSSYLKKVNFKPNNGDKVIISGSIKVYLNNSIFQIVATNIEQDGYGQLFIEFEKNKKLLEQQGYFDNTHKKEIPFLPNMIAVISGNNSAALKDVLTTLNNRYKLSKIVVFPSLVQGSNAANNIISLIQLINDYPFKIPFDVIILARGGGSIEDLNAFNDVALAKKIYESNVPIVTGIGHETDFTIADFVSDFRAATPTAAAIKVSIDKNELNKILKRDYNSITNRMNNIIMVNKNKINNIINSTVFKNPENIYLNKVMMLDQYFEKLNTTTNNNIIKYKMKLDKINLALEKNNINIKIEKNISILNSYNDKLISIQTKYLTDKRTQLNENSIKLNLLNPKHILDKGYSIVYKDNKLISNYQLLNNDDLIEIKNNKQTIKAKVIEVNEHGK